MSQIKDLFIRRSIDPDSPRPHGTAKDFFFLHFSRRGESMLQAVCKKVSNRAIILWLTTLLSNTIWVWAFCIRATCDEPSMVIRLGIVKTMRQSIACFWHLKWDIWVYNKAGDWKARFFGGERKVISKFLSFFLLFSSTYQEVRPGGFDYSLRKGWSESGRKRKLGKRDTFGPTGLSGEEGEANVWKAGSQLTSRGCKVMEMGEGWGNVWLRRTHRVRPASCLGCWQVALSQDPGNSSSILWWCISFLELL